MTPIKLELGGDSWSGWTFGPYGKAREWYLFSPNGEKFSAAELLNVRPTTLDVDYLQGKARRLQHEKAELEQRLARTFTPAELETLRAAVDIVSSRIDGLEKIKPTPPIAPVAERVYQLEQTSGVMQ